MRIKQYQIDAFADRCFEGNPAAVCPLESWLDDGLLQAIAAENNLSETAFFVPSSKGYHLRWFTPVREIDLCGHATLASAHVIFELLGYAGEAITFETKSGDLIVTKVGQFLQMDFPSRPLKTCSAPAALIAGLGKNPVEVLCADDYVAVFESEDIIRTLTPDLAELSRLDLRGVVVTAPCVDVDFVSRVFAPKFGIPEDPVTGSTHCELAPYWAARLGKNLLDAKQLSRRGGQLRCEVSSDRVLISGQAVIFSEGEIRF